MSGRFSHLLAFAKWGVISIALGTVIVFTLLPHWLALQIERTLTSMGMRNAQVEDVDFNPLTGWLAIRGLRAGDDQTLFLPLAKLKLAIFPLFQGQIHIEEGAVHQVTFTLRESEGHIALAGIAFPTGAMEETKGISLSLPRLFISGRVNCELQNFKGSLDIERLYLSWPGAPGAPLKAVGDFLFQGGNIHLEGRWQPEKEPNVIEGELQFKKVPLATFGSAWKKTIHILSGKATGSMHFQALLSKKGIEALSLKPSHLTLDRLHAVGEPIQEWKASQVHMDGMQGSLNEGLYVAAITGKNLQIGLEEESVAVRELSIEQLRMKPGASLIASTFKIRDLRHPDVQAQKIEGNALAYKEGDGWMLGSLLLADGALHLSRNQIGRWRFPEMPFRASKEKASLRVKANRVQAQNLRVSILDHGVLPTFQADVFVRIANIKDFAIPSQHPMNFEMQGQLGRFALLQFDGEALASFDHPTFNVKGNIQRLSLPLLSPYIRRMFGYDVVTGQLDASLTVWSQKGQIKGSGDLTLRQLQISPFDDRLAKAFTKDLAIPLESALDLLMDANGDIRLHLEASGDLSNPQFDLSDAFRQAMGKALMGGALAYLKYAIQPYGAMIAGAELALKAGKKLFKIQLDPILFPPGSEAFDPSTALPYLQKVGALMMKRKKLRLYLCGISTVDDLSVLENKDEALPLARRRAEHVKAAIEHLGVSGDRLYICLPKVEESTDGKPRVVMHIE